MRWCPKCCQTAESYQTKKGSCIACTKKANRKWWAENLQKSRQYSKKKREHPGYSKHVSNYRKRKRRTDPAYRANEIKKIREQKLKKAYGMTLADLEALRVAQGGGCAICGNTITAQSVRRGMRNMRDLSVDHDHATGKVRGLLCYHCNSGLGHFKDNILVMCRAIDYLRLHAQAGKSIASA